MTLPKVSERYLLQPVKQNKPPHPLITNSKEVVAHTSSVSRPELAAVSTSPQALVAMDSTMMSEMPIQPYLPGTPIISLSRDNNATSESSAIEMPLKQVLAPTNSVHALHEHSVKLQESEPDEDTSACNSDPIGGRILGSLSRERDSFVSELSGQALAVIYMIPKVNSNAIVGQAMALKFNMELVESKDDDEPNVLIILDHKKKARRLQTLLRAVTTSKDDEGQASMSTARLTMLQTSALAALVVGAVCAWAVLAFV